MGLIAKIIDSFTRGSVPSAKIELYKNDNANSRIYNPPGIDARPVDGDYCFSEISEDTEGGKDVLGFIDPNNAPVSEKGEIKINSRDTGGNIVSSQHLKNDGQVQIDSNSNLIANVGGNAQITATVIELNGNVDFAVRFNALNTQLQALIVLINALFATKLDGGGAAGALTLDLSTAKVDEVKLS